MKITQLCEHLKKHGFNVDLVGPDREIHGLDTLENADADSISFLANDKYLDAMQKTKAAAVFVKPDVEVPDGIAALRCADPYATMTAALVCLYGHRKHPQWGRSENAAIHERATIGKKANIAPFVTICENAHIGDNCTLYPGCFVGPGARIGNDCTLFANVVVYDNSKIGNRCTIHANSVIGEDGLGYAPAGEKWIKIPQVGTAIIHDDVEIGANCSIDRATLGTTEIGSGTKFSNQITVGHGCNIGEDCMFVGQVGLAGSTTVGKHVTLAGQVGTAGHLTIGDNATVGGQAGVAGNLDAGKVYLGSPAHPIQDTKRAMAAMIKLPTYVQRIRDLEKELKELRSLIEPSDSTTKV